MTAPDDLKLIFRSEGARLIAFVVSGTTILDVEPVETRAEGEAWFERMKNERPWETRQ